LTYQVAFVLNFLACYSTMKMVSWFCTPWSKRPKLSCFLLSPYLSIRSLNTLTHKQLPSYVGQFVVFFFLLALTVLLANLFLEPLDMKKVLLISPLIYFLTEVISGMAQIIFSPWGPSFPMHRHPLLSLNLSQFWGRNWNRWVQDWLKDVARTFGRRSQLKTIIVTFLFSGLFHEAMINLPYFLIYQKSYFGTMMLYFIIQSAALWVDKKFIRRFPVILQKIYLWVMIIWPSFLFVNIPLLTFLGLIHE
jgi:hypothetical protein